MAKFNVPLPKWIEGGLQRLAAPVTEDADGPVGAGDVVHGITQRLGIPHCAKCAKRKARGNRTVAFGRPR